jgi:hypothetical protein
MSHLLDKLNQNILEATGFADINGVWLCLGIRSRLTSKFGREIATRRYSPVHPTTRTWQATWSVNDLTIETHLLRHYELVAGLCLAPLSDPVLTRVIPSSRISPGDMISFHGDLNPRLVGV